MKIDLTDDQVSLIIDGLRALQENILSENGWLNNQDICKRNRQLADEIDSLCERLNFS